MTTFPGDRHLRLLPARFSTAASLVATCCAVVFCLELWTAHAAAADAALPPVPAPGKTVRLVTIGASFSKNAARFLPGITNAAGHKLVLRPAIIAASSLEQHWTLAGKAEANPEDPAGKPYGGKSLRELLQSGTWDVVAMQHSSYLGHDVSTYRPYAGNLRDYIRKYAPGSEVVIHQTWEYRVDDPRFNVPTKPYSQQQMYEELTSACGTIAGELGVRLIRVGEAFHRVDTDPQWGYQPDRQFDPKTAMEPKLPEQTHSLHVGWRWLTNTTTGKAALAMDGHHANDNGCYLAGCVWFEFLFGESAVGNQFIPEGMSAETAAYLQKVAHEVGGESAGKQVPSAN